MPQSKTFSSPIITSRRCKLLDIVGPDCWNIIDDYKQSIEQYEQNIEQCEQNIENKNIKKNKSKNIKGK